MKLIYEKIKNKPEVLISLTTLRREEFEQLSEFFEQSWQNYIKRYTLEGKPCGRETTIRSDTVLRTAEDQSVS